MQRSSILAPALIGLALAAPASARAQSHAHADCESCQATAAGVGVGAPASHGHAHHAHAHAPAAEVKGRKGLLARRKQEKVSIPAGHYVAGQAPVEHPTASPSFSSRVEAMASPPPSFADPYSSLAADPGYGYDYGYGDDPEAGVASIGGADDTAPPLPYSTAVASGEPMPIGEMRTSFVPPSPHAAPMAPSTLGAGPAPGMGMGMGMGMGADPSAAMNGGFTGVPVIPPDPAVQMWHQSGMANKMAPRRSGPLETMLGISSVTNWMEQRRSIRTMRAAAKKGMYAPSLHEMPAWAVNGQ
jgi:hypothetical protein